jgi:hypothetical protein
VFDAFMPIFCVLSSEILQCVIAGVTNVRVRMRGVSRKEFNCEVVDKLADWDHLEGVPVPTYRAL